MRHAGWAPEAVTALRDTNRLYTGLTTGLARPNGAGNPGWAPEAVTALRDTNRLHTGLTTGLARPNGAENTALGR